MSSARWLLTQATWIFLFSAAQFWVVKHGVWQQTHEHWGTTEKKTKPNHLLTAHNEQKPLVTSTHKLSAAAPPWGQSLICWKGHIQHCLAQTSQEEKVWTISAGLQFFLPLTLHMHHARTSIHGHQNSGRFNFYLRWATGGSYFVIIFPPPWWIKSPPWKITKGDTPIDFSSPASSIYTVILLKIT